MIWRVASSGAISMSRWNRSVKVPSPSTCRRKLARAKSSCISKPLIELSVPAATRSEEHTSELQSPYDLVCRLLLEKKKKIERHSLTTNYEKHEENCSP